VRRLSGSPMTDGQRLYGPAATADGQSDLDRERNGLPDSALATDQDRDAAVSRLRDGLVKGQLTDDEYAQRVGNALQARSVLELTELTNDLDNSVAIRPRSHRNRSLVIAAIFLAAGLGAVFIAGSLTGGQSPTAGPSASESVSTPTELPTPPSSPSLTATEFTLSPPPRNDYIGVTPVFTAHGVGSQTSPAFPLDGAQMMGTEGYDGATSFYLVPAGGSIASTTPFLGGGAPGWSLPWSGGDGNYGQGSYQLEVKAAPGTQWNLTLNEFWITPSGVTLSSAPAADNLGKPIFVATGSGDTRSKTFTLPADPIGSNSNGTDDIVVAFPLSHQGGGLTAAYLVNAAGISTSLPLTGGPIPISGPGPYDLVVEAIGRWSVAVEYGDQWQW
jgi:hypothetical protein